MEFRSIVFALGLLVALEQLLPAQRPGAAPLGMGSNAQPSQMARTRPPVAKLRIKLPFPEGVAYPVYQANHGEFSHRGFNAYAWDFGMPEGALVCAAAEGRVVRVKQDSESGGTTHDHYQQANCVVLDHGHGYFTQYLHLLKKSVMVKEGDLVRGGQVIARSGNTGYSSAPHLHFQVQDCTGQSLPATFLDCPGNGVPAHGQYCVSGNDGRGVTRYVAESSFPLDAFARNDIFVTDTDLPGHLLRTRRQYFIKGTTTSQTRRVAIYVMGSEGGEPLLTRYIDVKPDGSFDAKFDLADLSKALKDQWSSDVRHSNMAALAFAPVDENGRYWSDFSIPVSIR